MHNTFSFYNYSHPRICVQVKVDLVPILPIAEVFTVTARWRTFSVFSSSFLPVGTLLMPTT